VGLSQWALERIEARAPEDLMNCPHHPTCPGCPQLSRDASAQLATKRGRLQQALRRYPHVFSPAAWAQVDQVEVRPALRTSGYRHRLKLPVSYSSRGVSIGLYDRDGQRVLNTPDCPVLAEPLRKALPVLQRWLGGKKGVHSVDLRASSATGELQVVFACRGGELDGGARGARALVRDLPELTSVAVSTADKARKRVMGSRPRVVAGKQRLTERIGSTELSLHPGAFFQVDPENAVQLHGLVRDAVGRARRVLDLYSGVGAYGRMLATDPGCRVVAVEEVGAAVKSARAGAPRNFEVIEGRVEDVLDRPQLTRGAEVAILNPARRGALPSVLRAMAERVERVVYVSCGPEALARDLDVLAAHGMRVSGIEALDLFPQTAEVETVVHLERGPPVETWAVQGGRATHPWGKRPSGAVGKASELVALVIGDAGERGTLPSGSYRRLGRAAGHTVVSIRPQGHPKLALQDLARAGHPVAGRHASTDRFFAEKGGLLRPFVHISRAGSARAPLHGDLTAALHRLGATRGTLERAGARPEAAVPGLTTPAKTTPAPRRRGSARRGRGSGRRR